jgi:hypothetical protein
MLRTKKLDPPPPNEHRRESPTQSAAESEISNLKSEIVSLPIKNHLHRNRGVHHRSLSPIALAINPPTASKTPRHFAHHHVATPHFLIDSVPRLEIAATSTKQRTAHVSNRN